MTNAQESAFPIVTESRDERGATLPGLTKREYVAALVMSNMAIAVKAAAGTTEEAARIILRAAARASVAAADALFDELERESSRDH